MLRQQHQQIVRSRLFTMMSKQPLTNANPEISQWSLVTGMRKYATMSPVVPLELSDWMKETTEVTDLLNGARITRWSSVTQGSKTEKVDCIHGEALVIVQEIKSIICVNERWRNSILDCKTYPGADIGSDHNPVFAKVRVIFKKTKAAELRRRRDYQSIDPSTRHEIEHYAGQISTHEDRETKETTWEKFKRVCHLVDEKFVPVRKQHKTTTLRRS